MRPPAKYWASPTADFQREAKSVVAWPEGLETSVSLAVVGVKIDAEVGADAEPESADELLIRRIACSGSGASEAGDGRSSTTKSTGRYRCCVSIGPGAHL